MLEYRAQKCDPWWETRLVKAISKGTPRRISVLFSLSGAILILWEQYRSRNDACDRFARVILWRQRSVSPLDWRIASFFRDCKSPLREARASIAADLPRLRIIGPIVVGRRGPQRNLRNLRNLDAVPCVEQGDLRELARSDSHKARIKVNKSVFLRKRPHVRKRLLARLHDEVISIIAYRQHDTRVYRISFFRANLWGPHVCSI